MRRGLRVALTPSGTVAVTEEKLRRLRDAGLARLAVSLDGSTAAVHDAFRGVRGSYAWALRIIDRARALDLPLQVNTTITRRNLHDFVAMGDFLARFGIVLWSIFFLIPTGPVQGKKGEFTHPVELGDLTQVTCSDCHTGGASP